MTVTQSASSHHSSGESGRSSRDCYRQSQAVRELVSRGRSTRQTWPALLALREDENFAVRLEVALSTHTLGVSAHDAVPLLNDFLSDEHWLVRYFARQALEKYHSPPAGSASRAQE